MSVCPTCAAVPAGPSRGTLAHVAARLVDARAAVVARPDLHTLVTVWGGRQMAMLVILVTTRKEIT